KLMARRRAIIRRLTAVETLGSVNVICTDKTGTLTQNRMTVKELIPVSDDVSSRENLLNASVLCGNADVGMGHDVTGTPTEAAFLNFALQSGIDIDKLRQEYDRVAEIPFTSTRKRMATLHHAANGEHVLFVKGAVERILPACVDVPEQASTTSRLSILEMTSQLAGYGQRVLGFAVRRWPPSQLPGEPEEWESNLTFLGLISLSDPLRDEVPEAVDRCRDAGIRTILITGDHPETARSIAQQLQLWKPGENVLTGVELDQLSEDQFSKEVLRTNVFARVTPEHKLKIVRSLQEGQYVTAMTGDGVNDAPALKQADIGVAMGRNGTDVAKEASGMVLADDNFATIVAAVE
ncbi:MAG: cation-transporting P-type ATPase, partial [Planctomycetes bacterium]|nr:cation-transporting P-type ATPase [Planctomycetota bacterium]